MPMVWISDPLTEASDGLTDDGLNFEALTGFEVLVVLVLKYLNHNKIMTTNRTAMTPRSRTI